ARISAFSPLQALPCRGATRKERTLRFAKNLDDSEDEGPLPLFGAETGPRRRDDVERLELLSTSTAADYEREWAEKERRRLWHGGNGSGGIAAADRDRAAAEATLGSIVGLSLGAAALTCLLYISIGPTFIHGGPVHRGRTVQATAQPAGRGGIGIKREAPSAVASVAAGQPVGGEEAFDSRDSFLFEKFPTVRYVARPGANPDSGRVL
ncbi:unnamed protein product, partial [Phaeothamnion confervicola]